MYKFDLIMAVCEIGITLLIISSAFHGWRPVYSNMMVTRLVCKTAMNCGAVQS